jgi:ClpP class serine protease
VGVYVTRQSRTSIIDNIEQVTESRVLSYVTGARQGLEAQVGSNQLPLFRRHLQAIGDVEHISLIVHTNGGDTNMPWPLMNHIRAHAQRVTVLVPSVALSAGTLLTLGGDDILMSRYATLSPIDPTVANHFNPQDPTILLSAW